VDRLSDRRSSYPATAQDMHAAPFCVQGWAVLLAASATWAFLVSRSGAVPVTRPCGGVQHTACCMHAHAQPSLFEALFVRYPQVSSRATTFLRSSSLWTSGPTMPGRMCRRGLPGVCAVQLHCRVWQAAACCLQAAVAESCKQHVLAVLKS
jgi:hypothetical protein